MTSSQHNKQTNNQNQLKHIPAKQTQATNNKTNTNTQGKTKAAEHAETSKTEHFKSSKKGSTDQNNKQQHTHFKHVLRRSKQAKQQSKHKQTRQPT